VKRQVRVQGSDRSSGPEDLTRQRGRACAGEAVKRERAYSHKRARGREKEEEGEEEGETNREKTGEHASRRTVDCFSSKSSVV
jgi:hypothetical protein